MNIKTTTGGLLVLLLLLLSSCDLDINNPNAPTGETVLNDAAGIKAVAIGLQGRYGNALEEAIFISGLISGEIGNTNSTPSLTREFQDFPDAGANADIEDTNPELKDVWSKHYLMVKSANDLLENAGAVQLDPGTRSGIIALAKTLKAAAFATLIENFQQISINTSGTSTPAFVNRDAAITEALSLLSSATADLTATAPSSEFNDDILLSSTLDLNALISLLRARLSLWNGDYQNAITFADAIPAGTVLAFPYSDVDANPLFNIIFGNGYFGAIESFRSNAEAGDTRVDAFSNTTALDAFGGASLVGLNLYTDQTGAIDILRADEIDLIKAEANARLGQIPAAEGLVNTVRNANGLANTTLADQNAALAEILVQRQYSLFLSGSRWGDLRRFGVSGSSKVDWLPYPFDERTNNPNTPANP